jgi:hypothetical protein
MLSLMPTTTKLEVKQRPAATMRRRLVERAAEGATPFLEGDLDMLQKSTMSGQEPFYSSQE